MVTRNRVLATTFLAALTLAGCGNQHFQPVGAVSVENTPTPTDLATIGPVTPPPGSATPPPEARPVEPSLGTIPRVANSERVPMPLDPYMTSMSDIKLIDTARDVGAAECMQKLGFREWTADTIRTSNAGDYKEADLFEYVDPREAAAQGYVRPKDTSSGTAAEVRQKSGRQPIKDELQAYNGTASQTSSKKAIPAGGCLRATETEIYGKGDRLPVDPRSLAVQSRFLAKQDSRVKKALSEWSACMTRNGLQYVDPLLSSRDQRWATRDAATPASDEEKRVAGVDAACQAEVNLIGVYKTVRAAYESRLLEENRAKLEAAKPIFEKWVENSKAIIARN